MAIRVESSMNWQLLSRCDQMKRERRAHIVAIGVDSLSIEPLLALLLALFDVLAQPYVATHM
jgi:hypothetical protein